MRVTATIVLGCFLAGCSSTPVWVRPDATPTQVARDQQECFRLASSEARTQMWWQDPNGPSPYTPNDQFWTTRRNQYEMDYGLRQRQLSDICMKSRGYQLQEPGKTG
ncbi:MAG TPA: hypothetical protein VEU47_05705 [Candidatus Cybelea sp.]|nr:hypothetical protein [Candidatus Cybelea sp.]